MWNYYNAFLFSVYLTDCKLISILILEVPMASRVATDEELRAAMATNGRALAHLLMIGIPEARLGPHLPLTQIASIVVKARVIWGADIVDAMIAQVQTNGDSNEGGICLLCTNKEAETGSRFCPECNRMLAAAVPIKVP
jgi:hypothetical protein